MKKLWRKLTAFAMAADFKDAKPGAGAPVVILSQKLLRHATHGHVPYPWYSLLL